MIVNSDSTVALFVEFLGGGDYLSDCEINAKHFGLCLCCQ